MKIFFYKILFITIIFFSLSGVVKLVAAQENGTITLNKHIIDEIAKPRESFGYNLVVNNGTGQKAELYVFVNDITADDGLILYNDISQLNRNSSLARWVNIPRTIEVEPSEKKEIPLEIKIDPEAVPGFYHAVISFISGSNRGEAEAKINSADLKLLLNFNILDNKVEKLEILGFYPEKNTFFKSPAALNLSLSNTGSVSSVPKGEIIIYNNKGDEIKSINLKDYFSEIKSGETKKQIIDINLPLKTGKYKAKLVGEYGKNNVRDLQDVAFFQIIPITLILLIGGILLVVLIVLIIALILHNKKNDQEKIPKRKKLKSS